GRQLQRSSRQRAVVGSVAAFEFSFVRVPQVLRTRSSEGLRLDCDRHPAPRAYCRICCSYAAHRTTHRPRPRTSEPAPALLIHAESSDPSCFVGSNACMRAAPPRRAPGAPPGRVPGDPPASPLPTRFHTLIEQSVPLARLVWTESAWV